MVHLPIYFTERSRAKRTCLTSVQKLRAPFLRGGTMELRRLAWMLIFVDLGNSAACPLEVRGPLKFQRVGTSWVRRKRLDNFVIAVISSASTGSFPDSPERALRSVLTDSRINCVHPFKQLSMGFCAFYCWLITSCEVQTIKGNFTERHQALIQATIVRTPSQNWATIFRLMCPRICTARLSPA